MIFLLFTVSLFAQYPIKTDKSIKNVGGQYQVDRDTIDARARVIVADTNIFHIQASNKKAKAVPQLDTLLIYGDTLTLFKYRGVSGAPAVHPGHQGRVQIKGSLNILPKTTNVDGYSSLNLFQGYDPRGWSGINWIFENPDGEFRSGWNIATDIVEDRITKDSIPPLLVLAAFHTSDNATADILGVFTDSTGNGSVCINGMVPSATLWLQEDDSSLTKPLFEIHKKEENRYQTTDWMRMSHANDRYNLWRMDYRGTMQWYDTSGTGGYDYVNGTGTKFDPSYNGTSNNNTLAIYSGALTFLSGTTELYGVYDLSTFDDDVLSLRGNDSTTATMTGDAHISLKQNNQSTANKNMILDYNRNRKVSSIEFMHPDTNGHQGAIRFVTRDDGANNWGTALYLAPDRDVGIGTESPGSLLDVAGLVEVDSIKIGAVVIDSFAVEADSLKFRLSNGNWYKMEVADAP